MEWQQRVCQAQFIHYASAVLNLVWQRHARSTMFESHFFKLVRQAFKFNKVCHATCRAWFDKGMPEAQCLNHTFFKLVRQAFKFNKVCHATCFWHGTDSNIVLLPCQTKFINFDISFQKWTYFWFHSQLTWSHSSVILCYASVEPNNYKLLLSLTQPKLDVWTWPQSKLFTNDTVLLSWYCIDTLLSCLHFL